MIYIVKYKYNSKVYNTELEAKSIDTLVNVLNSLIELDVLEISKVIYQNNTQGIDDGNYYKYYKAKVVNDINSHTSIKIPHVKKTITQKEFEDIIKTNCELVNKSIKIRNIEIV